jgi:ppGpp synthetase/RelA/SpoT-type nucleotidyltranferase
MENVFLTINGKDEQTFLMTYSHNYKSVSEIGLDWQTLVGIHDYYLGIVKNKLEIAAQELFLDLKSIKGAHTVKYRIKDPEHLIDKIIRKKIEQDRVVTKENFLDEFDDFIGFRILHLFKTDWEPIYQTIRDKFESKETPVAYHRIGDDQRFVDRCKELGLEPKEKKAGYRSIHYIAKIPFFSTQFKCEIQIRTIFEEAWSEIDHLVRYPNNTDNELLNYYLLLFNRLAGCADEMGSFIMNMKANLEKSQNEKEDLLKEIGRLKGKNASQNKKIDELMEKLGKKNALDWFYVPGNPAQTTLDYITAIQNPSGSTFVNPLADMQESINRLSGLNDINKLYEGLNIAEKVFKMPKIGSFGLYTGEDLTKERDNNRSKDK